MELPRNITQIGETDSRCKIFVEDYVVSYLKQLNQVAQDKELAVALYGVRKEQDEASYLFLYGASKLDFLQEETRQLSQVQLQEVERFRKIYFEEYTFFGYCLLKGEMIEGFHIYENGMTRYISGYAQFYEKNDSMLAYMLNTRKEHVKPEVFDNEKYTVARRRREEQETKEQETKEQETKEQETKEYVPGEREVNRKHLEATGVSTNVFRRYKAVVVAVFALVCVLGYTYLQKNGGVEKLQEVASNAIAGIMEQQLLPDKEEVGSGTIATQDKLTDALEQENQIGGVANILEPITINLPEPTESVATIIPSDTISITEPVTTEPALQPATTEPVTQSFTTEVTIQPTEVEPMEQYTPPIEQREPMTYIVKQGDTLTGISLKAYGTDRRILEICNLNQIENPDDIKEGQKIFLP